MLKKTLLLILIILLFISTVAGYFIFFFPVSENEDNAIICYYVGHKLTQGLNSFEEKVRVLRDFVNENVHPVSGYDMAQDTNSAMTLLSGIGWCDFQARAFMQLASRIGIPARLLYLNIETGPSPHSVAEVFTPDKRWVIVDPFFKLDLINKEGKLASQSDIKEDPGIITNNNRVKLRVVYDSKWNDQKFVAIYYNTPDYVVSKKGKKMFFLDSIPVTWLRPIFRVLQNRAICQLRKEDRNSYEFMFLKARGLQLLNYYNEAEKLYDKIAKNSDYSFLAERSEFYKSVLLKDKGKFQEAIQYIDVILQRGKKNPYYPYLLGLKARILEKLGKIKEADEFLKEAKYSLQI